MTRNVRKALTPFCDGKSAEMLVFEHDAKPGEPICGSGLYCRFLNAGKRAELPVLRLHDRATRSARERSAASRSMRFSG